MTQVTFFPLGFGGTPPLDKLSLFGCGSKPIGYLLGRLPPLKGLFRVMGGTGF